MKLVLPANWLHTDNPFFYSELFRINKEMFDLSHSYADFCSRIDNRKMGEYLAKREWAANVFIACKLGKTGLAKTLAFPAINSFSELFDADSKPNAELAEWLKANMLTELSYYFEGIRRSDGILIIAQYNSIIGSRWLALLPTDAKIPTTFRIR